MIRYYDITCTKRDMMKPWCSSLNNKDNKKEKASRYVYIACLLSDDRNSIESNFHSFSYSSSFFFDCQIKILNFVRRSSVNVEHSLFIS